MNTATLVRTRRDEEDRHQVVYRLNPPHKGHEYVIASSVHLLDGFGERYDWETLILPSDGDSITSYSDLAARYDTREHALVLKDLGYTLEGEGS